MRRKSVRRQEMDNEFLDIMKEYIDDKEQYISVNIIDFDIEYNIRGFQRTLSIIISKEGSVENFLQVYKEIMEVIEKNNIDFLEYKISDLVIKSMDESFFKNFQNNPNYLSTSIPLGFDNEEDIKGLILENMKLIEF